MTSQEEIRAKYPKRLAERLIAASEINKEFLPTASFGINAHSGGLKRGTQTTVFGNQSAGKSGFMQQTVGINQKLGHSAFWIDAENSLDPDWAKKLGVDTDLLDVSKSRNIADFADDAVDMVKAGVDLMVLDSSSVLLPKAAFKDGEIKAFADRGQMGSMARDLGDAVATINAYNFRTCFVIISQVRMDLSGFMPSMSFTGGKANEHADQLRIALSSSMSTKKALHGNITRGDNVFDETVGRTVNWRFDKNKINGRENATGEYNFYTKQDPVGIDYTGEVLDYAIKHSLVKQGGAWFTIGDEKFQGKPAALAYLKESPETLQSITERLEGLI